MDNVYLELLNDLKNQPNGSVDYNRWLCIICPFLSPAEIDGDNYAYEHTKLDILPDGWRKLAEECALKVQCALEEYSREHDEFDTDDYKLYRVGERDGRLVWEDNNTKLPEELFYIIYDIKLYYILLSPMICLVCGKPATHVLLDSISNEPTFGVCEECLYKFEDFMQIEKLDESCDVKYPWTKGYEVYL